MKLIDDMKKGARFIKGCVEFDNESKTPPKEDDFVSRGSKINDSLETKMTSSSEKTVEVKEISREQKLTDIFDKAKKEVSFEKVKTPDDFIKVKYHFNCFHVGVDPQYFDSTSFSIEKDEERREEYFLPNHLFDEPVFFVAYRKQKPYNKDDSDCDRVLYIKQSDLTDKNIDITELRDDLTQKTFDVKATSLCCRDNKVQCRISVSNLEDELFKFEKNKKIEKIRNLPTSERLSAIANVYGSLDKKHIAEDLRKHRKQLRFPTPKVSIQDYVSKKEKVSSYFPELEKERDNLMKERDQLLEKKYEIKKKHKIFSGTYFPDSLGDVERIESDTRQLDEYYLFERNTELNNSVLKEATKDIDSKLKELHTEYVALIEPMYDLVKVLSRRGGLIKNRAMTKDQYKKCMSYLRFRSEE